MAFQALCHLIDRSAQIFHFLSLRPFRLQSRLIISLCDFRFLDSLNRILIGIGLVVLTAAVAMGTMLAKRLSVPLLNVAEVTRKITLVKIIRTVIALIQIPHNAIR